jgi:hypothetical protein
LPYFGPVAAAAYRANNFQVNNELPDPFKVVGVERRFKTRVNVIYFVKIFFYARVGRSENGLIKIFKPFSRFFYFLVNLFFDLRNVILNQNIGPETLLTVLVIDQRVVEGIHMAAGLPGGGMHKNSAVYSNNIIIKLNHGLPPIIANVLF